MKLILNLPKNVAAWLVGRPWLSLRYSPRPRLQADGKEFRIELHPAGKDASVTLQGLKKRNRTNRKVIRLVTGTFLSKEIRAALEAEGIGYVDSSGRLHLPWGGGLVHVDAVPKGRTAQQTASSALGVHGVRAVQAILGSPAPIQLNELAARVELSLSGTHAVLKLLESEGLVRVTGAGPSTRRVVVDRSQLLDWLAAQPAARRRERHANVAIYWRTPAEGWRRVRRALDRATIRHALTGSAAATALGAGPTNLLLTSFRIAPESSFAEVIAALGAEETDRGANLRLVRDTGMLGTLDMVEQHDLLIAPLPRVYLDILGERRGEGVAEHFREAVLGY